MARETTKRYYTKVNKSGFGLNLIFISNEDLPQHLLVCSIQKNAPGLTLIFE